MEERAKEVLRIGDGLFAKKKTIDSLWQEIALNFYPKRATFTTKRDDGEEYSDHLFSSYPSMARRELGNLLGEFLRPDKWFGLHIDDEELDESDAERAFMEHLTDIQWRAMNDPAANLNKVAIAADHDFVTFGNSVEWFGLNTNRDGLLFRSYHLRDCAWSENAEGKVDALHRNWTPTARQLKHYFGEKNISEDVKKACKDDPEKPFECRHVVLPARLYHYKSKAGKEFPFVSLWVERGSEKVLEEVGMSYFPYNAGRWQVISGSPYATSMATDVLLPDGRTLQVVMRTLREAGEMYVNPPMIATDDVVRSDIALYPGGITTVDREYDEKLGEALRPLTKDKSGFPIGMEIAEALKTDIRQGWMLDKIQLPETDKAMTATEIRRRIQEHIRASSPIVKPIQSERNNPLCEGVFNLLMSHGAFPMEDMPRSLQGRELKFKFRSPLDELQEQNEAEIFLDGRDRILFPALQIDPSLAEIVDLAEGTRDALRSAGFKQKWFKPKEAIEERRVQQAEEMEAQQMAAELAQGAEVAATGGKAAESITRAMNGGKPNGAAR
jgi:hypothetical protein